MKEDSAESSVKLGQVTISDLLLWLLIFAYVILNLALNSFNAYLLGPKQAGHLALEIPVFYTLCHQVTIVLFTSVWLYFVPEMRFNGLELFKSNWFQLICVSTIYAASIATNNASFATVSLTVNTIFKAAIPFPTIIFSYFIEGKTYSIRVLACVGVLVFGTQQSFAHFFLERKRRCFFERGVIWYTTRERVRNLKWRSERIGRGHVLRNRIAIHFGCTKCLRTHGDA